MSNRTLTFDIGGSSVKVALIEGGTQPSIAARPFDAIALHTGRIDELTHVVLSTTATVLEDVTGVDRVAISTTGIVGPDGIVTKSGFITGYAETSWAEALEQAFPGRFEVVHVANDGDCAAWAEFVCGSGRESDSLAHFVLGTGLGGGAILRGEIAADAPGRGGNFGHVPVPAMELATCTCGHERCSEAFAATRGVLRNAPRGATTIRELSALAMSADGAAVTAFATAGTWLGHAIAAVAGALKIETVTVGGGLAVAGRTRVSNVYVDAARTIAQELTGSPLEVLESQLGNDGGLLGAAALAAERRQPHETPGVRQDVGPG